MNTDRRRPTAPRDRKLLAELRHSDHRAGWMTGNAGRTPALNPSRDYLRGYSDGAKDARGAA